MTTDFIQKPQFSTPSVLDFTNLESLKHGVQTNPNSAETQRQVAREFEAIFIQMMLKQARKVSEQMPSFFDSQATRMAQSMGDEQLAMSMADPGIGLGDALMAQMNHGVLSKPLSKSVTIPESAPSRLPGLRSSLDNRRQVADSINSLIAMLDNGKVNERITGAIQGAPKHIRSFVDRMSNAAEIASLQSGVPAQLILSQAALESSWGMQEINHPNGKTSHNLFGIKAGSNWQGKTVNVMTTEFKDGRSYKTRQNFRAYDSYAESFADYAKLLGNSKRYAGVLQATNAQQAAQRVQAAGYATDPNYAQKLISIMSYFNTVSR